MTNVEALRKLAAAVCGGSESAVTGNTTAEIIAYIANNYSAPALPTTAGTYNLVIDSEGAATWTAVSA